MNTLTKFLLSTSALVAGASLVQGFIIEPNMLVMNKIKIIKNKQAKKPLHIIHISDIHLDDKFTLKKLQKLVRVINAQNPDLVFFTGDLTHNLSHYQYINKAMGILSQIKADIGKYAVFGNHDKMGAGVDIFPIIMQTSGFILLKNEDILIKIDNDRKLHLFGWDEAQYGAPDPSILLKAEEKQNQYNILLLHQPDLLEWTAGSHIHLALAGHSHGGQVTIPFVGPILTSNYSDLFHTNMYKIGDTYGYVNTGVGASKLHVRFFNPPKITIFDIYY